MDDGTQSGLDGLSREERLELLLEDSSAYIGLMGFPEVDMLLSNLQRMSPLSIKVASRIPDTPSDAK